MSPGEFVYSQTPLLTVAEMNPLNVEVYIPIDLYGKVIKGSPATILPESPIGGSYAARVVVVDQVFDAASGTYGARLELANPQYAIPAGLRCRVKFEL